MLKAAGPYIGFPFDHVISVQEAGYFKPHWKTYAKAEEIIGHDRSSILFVAASGRLAKHHISLISS